MNVLLKEIVRKSIHLCAALVPVALSWNRPLVLSGLTVVLLAYIVAEAMRQRGIRIPLIAGLTEAAARSRDAGKFVLGPVTLASGVIITALVFEEIPAATGIYALAFGDGLASLVGKLMGRCELPFAHGKTAAGSLACFGAIFCTTAAVTGDPLCALLLAGLGTVIELLPLKDLDNIFIPILIALAAQLYFQL